MKDPTYRVPADATATDIDLDTEELVFRGERLTDERSQAIVKEFRRGAGRPSLSPGTGRSPQVGVRVTRETRRKLQARANQEQKSVSDIIRDAIEHYV